MQYTTPDPRTGRVNIALHQDEGNIPMLFDVRYDWTTGKNVVVLNNWIDGKYDVRLEERPSGFPFDSGYLTTVKFVPSSAKEAYQIYVNGKFFHEFKYRVNGTPDKVEYIYMFVNAVPESGVQVAQLLVSLIDNDAVWQLFTLAHVIGRLKC